MGMREYEEMKHIAIPKEQEEMMNVICDAWDECRSLETCKECPDRPKEFMRIVMCTALKYTRKLIEAGYTKQSTADMQEIKHGTWRESLSDMFPDGTDYRCSVCGRTAILDSEYCPNCGAKMKRR